MTNLGKILGETVWKLKLELPEQILEKLYEHRGVSEYVTLTEAFHTISFEVLYEKAAILEKSRLIEFYTAPEAYAVFHEPDFIRARIRSEGIQYWKDHGSFLRKHKTPVRIAVSVLALIGCFYLINLAFIRDQNVLPENSASQPSQSVVSDSVTEKSDSPAITSSAASRLLTSENRSKPKSALDEARKSSQKDTVTLRGQKDGRAGGTKKKSAEEQQALVDLRHNYSIEVDTVNHLVKVWPRVGKWDSTVLAIPLSEVEFVHPEFQRQSTTSEGADFVFDAFGQRFSGIVSTASPASADVYYSLRYTNKPTLFLFGSYPNKLYPFYFGKGADK